MKLFLKGENGAASVLVIFMTLVLVTLGAYSISSAHVNYVFSERALEWKQSYYECDAEAVRFLMDADIALAAAEQDTAEAVISRSAVMPSGDPEQAVNELFNQNVLKEISLLADKYDIQIKEGGPDICTAISSDSGARINVRIAAMPFRFEINTKDGAVSCALKGDTGRYKVLEWKEEQQTVRDTAQEPLWDGIVRK